MRHDRQGQGRAPQSRRVQARHVPHADHRLPRFSADENFIAPGRLAGESRMDWPRLTGSVDDRFPLVLPELNPPSVMKDFVTPPET